MYGPVNDMDFIFPWFTKRCAPSKFCLAKNLMNIMWKKLFLHDKILGEN